MRLKIYSQNPEIKQSKVKTHNFDACFLKTSKAGDETKQFYHNDLFCFVLSYQMLWGPLLI